MKSMNGFRMMGVTVVFLLICCTTTVSSIATGTAEIPAGQPQEQTLIRNRRYPGGSNSAEFWFCAQPWRWRKCKKVKRHAKEATDEATRRFPTSLHNGNGDAFRHCYWSARMTRDMGVRQATRFGNRHERTNQPALEKEMDYFNNAVGRSVGQSRGSYQSDTNECARLTNTGGLRIYNGNSLLPSG